MHTEAEDDEDERIRLLEKRLRDLERQVDESRAQLESARERRLEIPLGKKEEGIHSVEVGESVIGDGDGSHDGVVSEEDGTSTWNWPMKREEYKRYGRQLIMPEIGIRGTAQAFILFSMSE